MLRPLCSLEIPGVHCTITRVGLAAGLNSTKNLSLTGVRFLDLPVRSDSLSQASVN
jgi:hypothetical protein